MKTQFPGNLPVHLSSISGHVMHHPGVHMVQTVSITHVGGAGILPFKLVLLVMPRPGDDGNPGALSIGP